MAADEVSNTKQTIRLSLDLRWVVLILLVVIAAMIVIWKPWSRPTSPDSRTIEVSGDTTLAAVPDEFVFSPTYQSKNTDKTAALKELTAKSNEIVAALKKLGVPDKGIKTNASGYDYPVYYDTSNDATYSLEMTVTVDNKDLAQKAQDYLLTTAPTGDVTPQSNFSEQKRKSLEATARDQATKDARAKAEQMGKNLGFKLGKVKSVNDGGGFGGTIRPMLANGSAMAEDKASNSLSLQPGENELPYNVTIVYYIR